MSTISCNCWIYVKFPGQYYDNPVTQKTHVFSVQPRPHCKFGDKRAQERPQLEGSDKWQQLATVKNVINKAHKKENSQQQNDHKPFATLVMLDTRIS